MPADVNTDLTVYDSTGAAAITIGSHVTFSEKDPRTGAVVIAAVPGRVIQMLNKHDHKYVRCMVKRDDGLPDTSRHNTGLTVIP